MMVNGDAASLFTYNITNYKYNKLTLEKFHNFSNKNKDNHSKIIKNTWLHRNFRLLDFLKRNLITKIHFQLSTLTLKCN